MNQMRVVAMALLGVVQAGCGCLGAGAQEASAKRPPITGLAYVRFYESDMAAAKVFYAQRLGLPETDRPDGVSSLAIGARQQVQIAPLPSPAPKSELAVVGFLTSDLPAMERYLKARSVAFTSKEPGEIELTDPIGTHVALVAEKAMTEAANHAPKTAATPTSRRMIHAGWGVSDRAAEDRFYKDLLGFRPYWFGGAQPDRTDWVSLQVPEGTDWIEYMLQFKPDADRRQIGVLDHISLGVNQITQATDRLVANGWTDPQTRKTQLGMDGKWQLNVFDPDQSRVEFMEFQPVKTPCCSPFTAKNPPPEAQD